jgi:O-antigen/teichoic acid export membrane protein
MSQEGDSRSSNRRVNAAQASLAVVPNTFWDLLGTGLPILLALVTIPVLIHSIGTERFGILVIAWSVLSYFGLFDLGLGRATIKFLAEAFEHDRIAEGRTLFWTFLLLNGCLGLVGGAILWGLSPLLIGSVLNVPAELQPEALGAFRVLAVGVPLVTLTATLRGSLEAQHRFGLVNALQVPNSSLVQVAPLLALIFSQNLKWLIGALVLARLFGASTFMVAALRQIDRPFKGPFFSGKKLRTIFSYSSWQAVTNTISPIMVNADRLAVGALSSLTAVTYYATSAELIQRLLIIPQSVGRTTFPIFSAGTDIRQRTRVYVQSVKYLTLILAALSSSIIVFAPDLLRLWLGPSFAETSATVLQILAVGLLLNSLAVIPFGLIQGLGRADITAKFHLLELPVFLLLLWYGIQQWGIVGAALAWTVRVGADFLLLTLYVRRTNRVDLRVATEDRLPRVMVLPPILLAVGWFLQVIVDQPLLKVLLWAVLLSATAYLAWQWLLTTSDKRRLAGYGRKVTTFRMRTPSVRNERV